MGLLKLIWSGLFTKVGGLIAALAGVLGAVLAIRGDAKRDERKRAELKALQAAQRRQKEIDDAVESSHAGGAAWLDRLSDDTNKR